MNPRTHTILAIASATGLLVGCGAAPADQHHGAAGGHPTTSEPAPGARAIAVTATTLSFTPNRLDVAAGEEVALSLTSGDVLHDFTIDGMDVHVAADAGRTTVGRLHVTEPGTYTAYCSVPGHRAAGMTATVVVAEDVDEQPA